MQEILHLFITPHEFPLSLHQDRHSSKISTPFPGPFRLTVDPQKHIRFPGVALLFSFHTLAAFVRVGTLHFITRLIFMSRKSLIKAYLTDSLLFFQVSVCPSARPCLTYDTCPRFVMSHAQGWYPHAQYFLCCKCLWNRFRLKSCLH